MVGNHGGRKGMVGREGGGKGMVGMREGMDCMLTLWNINNDDANIVTIIVIPREPASLGCHAMDATLSCLPVGSSVVLGTWVCLSFPLVATGCCSGHGCCCRLSQSSIWCSFVCWALAFGCQSLSSLCAVIEVLGVVVVWAAGVVCGGVSHVTWHAGDMDGTHFVVAVGNMGVWLSCLVVRRLLWFVGSRGC